MHITDIGNFQVHSVTISSRDLAKFVQTENLWCLLYANHVKQFFFFVYIFSAFCLHFLQLWDTVNKWSQEITSIDTTDTNNDNVQIKDEINQVEKIVEQNKNSAIADALTKQAEVCLHFVVICLFTF